MSNNKKNITVLKGYQPLNEEELSVELTPNFHTEASAELSQNEKIIPLRNKNDKEISGEKKKERSGVAVTGIIFSVLSLFFLPYLFAPIGIFLGYLGYRGKDKELGFWAMGLGVIGLFGTLIVNAIV